MPIDVDKIFARGGKELIDVLNDCVRSVQMDPVFAFLVNEYRLLPTAAKALALYDMFLAADAPARIDALDLLPPRELTLEVLIQSLRPPKLEPGLTEIGPAKRQVQPGKFIFDTLDAHVRRNRRGSITRMKRRYHPKLTPTENLPGGQMTPGQRRFVEQVWQPHVRRTLVLAGFRRIENIA